MQRRFHIPTHVQANGGASEEESARLQQAVLAAIRRAIEEANVAGTEVVSAGAAAEEEEEEARQLFAANLFNADRGTYTVPSYQEGGTPTEVPIAEQESVAWTRQMVADHILEAFGTYGPRGQTHYGAQIGNNIQVIRELDDGRPQFDSYSIDRVRVDVEGHIRRTGERTVYGRGRYLLEVTGPAPGENPPRENVASVRTLDGEVLSDNMWTNEPIGLRIVFDVPEAPPAGGRAGARGTPGGAGILLEDGVLIPFQCHPTWDTRPLTDPAFAGMTDDDLFRLFINLCNARAIHNLDLSEQYIRTELVPRYTGPGGATNTLSDFSEHNLQHFRERLHLLRGLMHAYYRLSEETDRIQAELGNLILRRHRTSRQYRAPLGFGAGLTADVFWPTVQRPAPQHAARAEQLRSELEDRSRQFRTVLEAILRLLEEDPILSHFVTGLETEGTVDVPDDEEIDAELADIQDLATVQRRILEDLNDLILTLHQARAYLCREPERILDVPLVYNEVLTDLEGINPRFDEVARQGIRDHQEEDAWTEIGLGAAGLVLFVGGLIVSLAGGPAGVIAFLGVAGTVLGGVSALRSLDRAAFSTTLSEATVMRGRGLVSLEAASDARFWATVDSILLAVDVLASIGDVTRAVRAARPVAQVRQAQAATRLGAAAEEFGELAQASRRLDFESLLERAAPRGQLDLAEEELRALGQASTGSNALGRITEEIVERTVVNTDEYVALATKVRGNQGIDLVFVRRSVFEGVFGPLSDPTAARRVLSQASDEQIEELSRVLTRGNRADDLVSVEVKFSRSGTAVEELLGTSRGGVQFDRVWFGNPDRGVLQAMLQASDAEVRATGQLLQEVIGTQSEFLGRMARIGISVDPSGVYRLTPLTDELIDMANHSRNLYRSRRYWSLQQALRRAVRENKLAQEERYRHLLTQMNRRIDELDGAVRRIREAHETARRVVQWMQRAEEAATEINALSLRPATPGITQALHTLTGTTRTLLEAVQHGTEESQANFDAATRAIDEAEQHRPTLEAEVDLELEALRQEDPELWQEILRDTEGAEFLAP